MRFYDAEDFSILRKITNAREWSNRLTVASILVALVAFSVEWNRRNRETARMENERAEEANRRIEETRAENERAEERTSD